MFGFSVWDSSRRGVHLSAGARCFGGGGGSALGQCRAQRSAVAARRERGDEWMGGVFSVLIFTIASNCIIAVIILSSVLFL